MPNSFDNSIIHLIHNQQFFSSVSSAFSPRLWRVSAAAFCFNSINFSQPPPASKKKKTHCHMSTKVSDFGHLPFISFFLFFFTLRGVLSFFVSFTFFMSGAKSFSIILPRHRQLGVAISNILLI